MKPWVRKAHRWLGLLFSLTILMSSGSGVIHTVMTRTQAPPPAARPASGGGMDVSSIRITASEAVMRLPEGQLPTAINLRNISGKIYYQILTNTTQPPFYVDATSGTADSTVDETYAREIARNFLSGKPVEKTDYLTHFNLEYIGIFRILPVYRFEAKDSARQRVYVSTITGSVTRHTDDQKQFEANVFTLVHKFGFIRNKELRDWSLILVTSGAFIISVLGIALFFMTRPRRKKANQSS